MINSTLQVRVYYEDTDAGGVVYHANYLKYFERARTEMLREAGFEHDKLLKDEQVIFIVYKICIDYLKPALMNDMLTISSSVIKTGSASIFFEQSIQNQNDGLVCKAEVRVACVDRTTLRPVPIPEPVILELDNVN